MTKRLLVTLLLTIAFTIPIIAPLWGQGFFKSDDGDQMITRLYAFNETLKTGQFPVRFLEKINHGFGYPVLNFLYPLPFYFGEAIHILGFNYVYSIKILFALGIIFGALAMALWIYSKWGATAAIFAAVFYTYAPYKILDVYQRGSLGEVFALIFIPLIFYGIDRKFIAIGALAYAGLITSHNVLAFIFTPVILLYVLVTFAPRFKIFLSLLLGILVAAFFWIPALVEIQYTWADKIQVSDFTKHFLERDQFFTHLGFLIPAFLLFGLLAILKIKKPRRELMFWVVVGLVTIFLSLPQSKLIWDITPLPKLVQFPWRFLAITLFCTSIVGGLLVSKLKPWFIPIAIILLVFLLGLKNISVNRVFYPESYYIGNDGTTTVKNEYSPKWVKNQFLNAQPVNLAILSGRGNTDGEHLVDAVTPLRLRINRVYFPGWNVFVDGKVTTIDYQKEGFLDITVPPGTHQINYVFQETPVRKIADIVTLGGVITILLEWRRLAQVIGNFQTQIILSVFYLVLFLPLGLVYKFFLDPFGKQRTGSNFNKWEHGKETLESAHHQF
ncbi:hypothetical protein HY085_02225 [Candidatus Gottesmanbacteria bacterium]|nr:hypothetical protein [Candidatus Gottesmanbacteria bacterium]